MNVLFGDVPQPGPIGQDLIIDPYAVTGGRPVGLLWASPDCKHHSKAKGGRPVKRSIRDLAWVVVRWARQVRPKVIILENVEEFRHWGPLVEREPDQWVPCPNRKGETFLRWVKDLRRLGYRVEYRELRGCDFGAPTIRKRLFVIARRDGEAIVWPKPTHGDSKCPAVQAGKMKPWPVAADIIDWSLPCPSIFMTREEVRAYTKATGIRINRPLAENTLKRIAKGVMRYVVEAKEPFFVSFAQHGGGNRSGAEPHHTVTASTKDQNCVVTPYLVPRYQEKPGHEARTRSVEKPAATIVAGGSKHAVVSAFLAQHNTGVVGHDARSPVSTIVGKGCTQGVVAAHLMNMKGSARAPRSMGARDMTKDDDRIDHIHIGLTRADRHVPRGVAHAGELVESEATVYVRDACKENFGADVSSLTNHAVAEMVTKAIMKGLCFAWINLEQLVDGDAALPNRPIMTNTEWPE